MNDDNMTQQYLNGYIERKSGGTYEGELTIDGVRLGGIVGVYFKEKGESHLWLRRKTALVYEPKTQKFVEREQRPKWETYLKKVVGKPYTYFGTFMFFRFKYDIFGIWDKNSNIEKGRLGLYVERLPTNKQDIIVKINENNNGKR